MTEKELITWFWDLYNSCYPVRHSDYPDNIFMYYDEQFVRYLKLCKISNKEIKMPTKVKGYCLFDQDWKYNVFCYDYDKIYLFLKLN